MSEIRRTRVGVSRGGHVDQVIGPWLMDAGAGALRTPSALILSRGTVNEHHIRIQDAF